MENNTFTGFLVGLAAGIGIGILLAPRSGEETRARLADAAAKGSDYARKRAEDLKGSASDLVDRASNSANDFMDRASDEIGRNKKVAKDIIADGRKAAREYAG